MKAHPRPFRCFIHVFQLVLISVPKLFETSHVREGFFVLYFFNRHQLVDVLNEPQVASAPNIAGETIVEYNDIVSHFRASGC